MRFLAIFNFRSANPLPSVPTAVWMHHLPEPAKPQQGGPRCCTGGTNSCYGHPLPVHFSQSPQVFCVWFDPQSRDAPDTQFGAQTIFPPALAPQVYEKRIVELSPVVVLAPRGKGTHILFLLSWFAGPGVRNGFATPPLQVSHATHTSSGRYGFRVVPAVLVH